MASTPRHLSHPLLAAPVEDGGDRDDPARAGTEEAQAAKAKTPRRRGDDPEREAASEAAASSADEVAEAADQGPGKA